MYLPILIFILLSGLNIYLLNYFDSNSLIFLMITAFVSIINAIILFYIIVPEYLKNGESSNHIITSKAELEYQVDNIRNKYSLLIKEIEKIKHDFCPNNESDYSNMKFEFERIEYDEKISFYRKEMLKEIETLIKNAKLRNDEKIISNQTKLQ